MTGPQFDNFDDQALGDALRAAPLPTPPAGSHARWAAALRKAREQQVVRLTGWMTAAAAIVLAITLPMARTNSAEARPTALDDWETAAVGNADDVATPQAQARVIAVDLAMPAGNAGNGGGR